MAVSFTRGRNRSVQRKPHELSQVIDKLHSIMLYLVHLVWAGFELTTSVVIDTDFIWGNYHMKSNAYIFKPIDNIVDIADHDVVNFEICRISPKYVFSWAWSYCSWIYNYLCNQCLSPLMLWVRISIRGRCKSLLDKVCQWLATGRWFFPGPPVSSTNKTDRQDKTEILLNVALNTIRLTLSLWYFK